MSILLQHLFIFSNSFKGLFYSFKFRGTFGFLLAPVYALRINYQFPRQATGSLFVSYLSTLYGNEI
nr:MAG TPA: hypothetical protein [Caudoviricetes sp.]